MDQQRSSLFNHINTISRIQVQISTLRSQFRLHERYHDIESIHQGGETLKDLQLQLDQLQPTHNNEFTFLNSLKRSSDSVVALYAHMLRVHSSNLSKAEEEANHHYLLDRLDSSILSMSEDSFRLADHALKNSQEESEYKARLMQSMLIILAILISLSAFQTLRLFRIRLKELEQGIKQLSVGKMDYTIDVGRKDEISQLAQHFNQMTNRLKASTISVDQLQQEISKRTSELEQQKNSLRQIAEHDSLTGLANREAFLKSLNEVIIHCSTNKRRAAVFFIDLDKFKQINDSMGHSAGDAVLIEMAHRFTSTLRKSDSLARIGGDEFTVIIDPLYESKDAAELAKKLIASLEEPYEHEEQTLYLNTSIGIAVYPEDGATPQELMKNADSAMYQAKQAGGNTFHFYNRLMNQDTLAKIQLESELRTAIQQDQLTVYYQPQFDLKTRKLVGVEALARWIHPEKGLIPPCTFIPLAEEKGLIHQVGSIILTKACRQMAQWNGEREAQIALAVNLSAKQLNTPELAGSISDILHTTGLNAQHLELEITESCVLSDPEDAIHKLEQLKALGIRLAMDDFGTGYSSLAYLKKLPLDKLKIDKSFVDGLEINPEDAAICQAVIALGHSLNLTVIAEGLEHEVQATILAEQGCDQAQGYFFAKPISAENFARSYFKKGRKLKQEENA